MSIAEIGSSLSRNRDAMTLEWEVINPEASVLGEVKFSVRYGLVGLVLQDHVSSSLEAYLLN